MLSIRRQGNIDSVVRALRDVPARVIPYATSTALTRTAQAAQTRIVAEMPRVFAAPTRYTLNSTFVRAATVKTLAAQVAVKNQAAGGTQPEHYLEPEVFGGARREKRFERALRYAGVLPAGQHVVPGRAAPLDAAGNLRRGDIAGGLGARARRTRGARYFVAGRIGVFKRAGGTVTPIMIFVRRTPQYGARLDFAGIASAVAQEHFRDEFGRAAAAIMSRGSR